MNDAEISTLYKERLLSPEISPDGNCGLGMLEIARQSHNHMTYSFSKTSTNETYYSLKVSI
jgi:hypothetical protein